MYHPIVIENRCNARAGTLRASLREYLEALTFTQHLTGVHRHSNFVTSYEGVGYSTSELRRLKQIAHDQGIIGAFEPLDFTIRKYAIFFVDERNRLYRWSLHCNSDVIKVLEMLLKKVDPLLLKISRPDEGHYRKEF